MKVFVCGSANQKIHPKYLEGIDKIAEFLATNDIELICVASSFGAIGEVYRKYEKHGGHIDLIQPKAYAHETVNMKGDTLIKVDNLYELQQIATRNSEVTLVLPGGNGTLAELYMITDSIKSKFDTDPVIIYNVHGFYDRVKEMNDFFMDVNVLEQFQYDYFNFCNTPEEVISALKKALKIK